MKRTPVPESITYGQLLGRREGVLHWQNPPLSRGSQLTGTPVARVRLEFLDRRPREAERRPGNGRPSAHGVDQHTPLCDPQAQYRLHEPHAHHLAMITRISDSRDESLSLLTGRQVAFPRIRTRPSFRTGRARSCRSRRQPVQVTRPMCIAPTRRPRPSTLAARRPAELLRTSGVTDFIRLG
jgi:hypothetical protein